ncbi:hypothetical protein SERLA73DRAFT_129845 [Serpula lacrymans var. lacrymans S7.3]|uniref:Uncharacterized protein n=2 Tax=Serpula lacrymans var. lacrymans TaxID=341189 RepID=F8PJU3_SERL3|nr:uncharacterized protein SERLADRAFT_456782 [Serpula lacrymans var. lacrymans S7.9]EGO03503.1 hypothetical protein SERLA73DRAFT_129845 [Serpula lacrymans var. lacrymans S7.3]EGO29254.1 hypothetical protein SERLADRAFT_456782 [Serpula lacrymans var. lacrymans S7.9]
MTFTHVSEIPNTTASFRDSALFKFQCSASPTITTINVYRYKFQYRVGSPAIFSERKTPEGKT